MNQTKYFTLGTMLAAVACCFGSSLCIAQEWDRSQGDGYPPKRNCHRRFRFCKEPPRGGVAYSFTGVVNQDNPLNGELQSRSEEFDDRLTKMETQMNDLMTEFRVLMEVLGKEPSLPQSQQESDEAGGGLEDLEGGGAQPVIPPETTGTPPPVPGISSRFEDPRRIFER